MIYAPNQLCLTQVSFTMVPEWKQTPNFSTFLFSSKPHSGPSHVCGSPMLPGLSQAWSAAGHVHKRAIRSYAWKHHMPHARRFKFYGNWSMAKWLSRSGMLLKPIVNNLVGGFNPFEKYQSNWIISPGKGENKNLWNYYHCNRGWPGWLQKMYHCPKIEIEPEKHDLDDDLPLPKMHSQVPC